MTMHWIALREHVALTIAELDIATTAGIVALPGKHIDLMGQAHIDLSGQRYVDEWLVPTISISTSSWPIR